MSVQNHIENEKKDIAFRYINGMKTTSKRLAYGWSKLGSQGEFMMLNKEVLEIPVDSYQREAAGNGEGKSNAKVLAIAREFDWVAFGVLIVTRRNDGSYQVTEGGHRARAVKLRDDITTVPCLVFTSISIEKEAGSFITVNTKKSNVSAYDLHRAGIIAKDDISLAAESLVNKVGYEVVKDSKKKYGIAAIGTVKSMIRRDRDVAEMVLGITADIAKGEQIPASVMRGLFFLAQCEVDLKETATYKKIMSFSIDLIVASMNREKAILGKGGERIEAKAILDMINKNRRNKVFSSLKVGSI